MNAYIAPGLSTLARRKFIYSQIGTSPEESEVMVKVIIDCVTSCTGIAEYHMKSSSRKREHTIARQIAMTLIRQQTKLSLKSVGKIFGDRDHSTVIYAKETFNDLMETDTKYSNLVATIERKVSEIKIDLK